MTRREFSRKVKFAIIKRASASGLIKCEGCGLVLPKKWEIDHILPEALVIDKSKPLTAEDGQLLGRDCCHRGGRNKTADDVRRIRKADRQRDKHIGAFKSARPMTGSRASKWKKHMDGRVSWR